MNSVRKVADAELVRLQRAARTIEREVAPIWHDRFSRLIMRDLPDLDDGLVLDIQSGTGRTTDDLLLRLGPKAKVLGLQPEAPKLSVAKIRLGKIWGDRVFLKQADFDDVGDAADDSYALTVANLVLGDSLANWREGLAEMVRVTAPDGRVHATLELRGSWAEVEDVFDEVLRERGLDRARSRLAHLRERRPTPRGLAAGVRRLGFEQADFVVEHESFQVLFRSGRELLLSSLVEHVQLPRWRAAIGEDAEAKEVFWDLKSALDAYFSRGVIAVTIVAGLVRVQPPGARAGEMSRAYWSRFPTLDAVWSAVEASNDESVRGDEEIDIEFDLSVDEDDTLVGAGDGLDDFLELGVDRDLDPSSAPDSENILDIDEEDATIRIDRDAELEAVFAEVLVESEASTPALPVAPSDSVTAGAIAAVLPPPPSTGSKVPPLPVRGAGKGKDDLKQRLDRLAAKKTTP